jgi:outer membrane protein TolC
VKLALLLVALGQHAPQRISVDEGVKLTLKASPQLRAVGLHREAALSQADSLRGRMLPLIALSNEWDAYNAPFSLKFALPGAPASVPAPSLTVRYQYINTFAASVTQPLLGLFRTYEERASVATNADALADAAKAVEAGVREAIQTGFLRYYEAKAAEEIAFTSQKQLEEQVTLVLARVKAGTATNADKLRIDVAIANAKLNRIQAQAQEDAVRTSLLLAMALPANGAYELVEPTELQQRTVPQLSEENAIDLAAKQRPEVAQAVKAHEAASQHATASYLALLPELSVDGVYTNLFGQAFAPPNQYYFGVKASWPIWEWGATYYAARSADQNAEAAQADLDGETLTVKNEASSRWVQAQSAASAIPTAQTTIASAEEAYRVTQATVNAGVATTTDLLDAQSALTQAKLNLLRARYTLAIALVALQRALGS